MNPKSHIWRTALIFFGLLIAWKIVALNLANYYVDAAKAGDIRAVDTALFWDGDHPRALALKGQQLLSEGNTAGAESYFVRAIEGNPADARPLLKLAELRRQDGEEALADQMIATASLLMPVNPIVQERIAIYWYERDRLDLAVPHLATALSADHSLRTKLYPVFLQIAENEAARPLLVPLATNPPGWWEGFFVYATQNANNIDALRAHVTMREASLTSPLTDRERNAYIARLRKDGLVAEAYLHWVNGLDTEALQSLGYLYNGNFEREISSSGFGWYARPPKNSGIRITTSIASGMEGKEALRLSFQGKRVKFNHLYQNLFLSPGNYQLSGRVRPDKLKARRGLQWVVHCTAGERGKIGESELFHGLGDWRSFDFAIEVPPGCAGQSLKLYSVGSREVDHELNGAIWFDDMHIQLQRPGSGEEILPTAKFE